MSRQRHYQDCSTCTPSIGHTFCPGCVLYLGAQPTRSEPRLPPPSIAATVRLAIERTATDSFLSCDDCPWGIHLDPVREWYNDPTEAYFRCNLGLGPSPERQWGEYAPCTLDARLRAILGLPAAPDHPRRHRHP